MVDWKSTLKASGALMISTITTFSSKFDESSLGLSYFVSLAVLFFHPSRSVGAMVESVLFCAIGLFIGYLIASFCLFLVEFYENSGGNVTEANIISVLILFITTFCLAFIRAKYAAKKQVIATACSLVHILTFATITQMGMDETLNILPGKIDAIVVCMMIGTLLSFLICVLFYPKTASDSTQKTLISMMETFKDIIDFADHTFLSKMINSEVSEEIKVLEEKLKSLDSKLSSISGSKSESYYEPFSKVARFRSHYNRIISITEELVLHFASLVSTMSSMWVLKDDNQLNKDLYQDFFNRSLKDTRDLLYRSSECSRICSNLIDLNNASDQDLIIQFESLYKGMGESLHFFQDFQRAQLSNIGHDLDMKTYQIYFFVFGIRGIAREILMLMDSIRGLIHHEIVPADSVRDWNILKYMSSLSKDIKLFQIRFALKTAFAITLMGIPAFLDETKHAFYQYRLSWAMSSTIVVLTYSVGGTSAASWYRILGTLAGVLVSILIWLLFPENPIGLFISFGCISVPSFYFRFNSKFPKVAQIFLLTFSLIILQKYSSLEDPVFDNTYTIYEIALRRGFAVSLGVLVGIFVSRNIWPYEARTAVRKGISQVYQDISTSLIEILNLINLETDLDSSRLKELISLELNLRLAHSDLENSLKETNHEALDFPSETYFEILSCIQKILNRFSSIRIGVSHDELPRSSKRDMNLVDRLCKDMIDQVLLHFYVLSGAMKLKFALPPRLSDMQGSRRRLLQAISELSPPHPPFYMAYVLEDVIEELVVLEHLTRSLFGFIGPTLSLSERFSAIQKEKSVIRNKGKKINSSPYERPKSKPNEKPSVTSRSSPRRKQTIKDRLGPKSALERLGPKASSIQKTATINSRLGKKK